MVSGNAAADGLLAPHPGDAVSVLGNEAVVRGALEAGVAFATGYPGTPSSEITDSFARVAAGRGIAFEYAVNEKIALELAFAASLAGARSICAMKHLGLLVAGDPLSTIPYIGVVAGMVIVSAGDPGMHTSPNEQDQRHLGPMLHVPILDPSSPAEAHAMTRYAFELSEAVRLPVILRTTTRVAHGRAAVTYGELRAPHVGGFERAPAKYVPVPFNARRMRLELVERIARAAVLLGRSPFVDVRAEARVAVLASGAVAAVCRDLARDPELSGRFALWQLGAVHPLAEEPLVEALSRVDKVLVVEELSPFLENALLALAARRRLPVEILGKHSGHLREPFELSPADVEKAVRAFLGLPAPATRARSPVALPGALSATPRPPSLCPGCPHRAAFFAARSAFDEDQLFFNDIGCYSLGYGPPHETADALLCMGASITLAAGVARVTGKRTVGFIGDSTFFHAGMPALLDAIQQRANIIVVVLDNQVTGMTGFQESPSAPAPSHASSVAVEDVARALGAASVDVVDPYDLAATIAAYRRAREVRGTSVVVARRACPVHAARQSGRLTRPEAFEVDGARCRQCGRESLGLRCSVPTTPGFERSLARARSVRVDETREPAVAPCAARCPLSLCIQGYVGHVAAGEYAEALAHVLERTALPESVCRVCDHPCEQACVRRDLDAPVAVNALKRFVVAWAARERPELFAVPPVPLHGGRVAVVGAGPAGLAAAFELRQRGYEVALHDAADVPGGLLAAGIPHYRLPPEALARDVRRVLEAGVRFVGKSRLGRDVSLGGLLAAHDAVVLCVGAWRAKRLGLEIEPTDGGPAVVQALGYLASATRDEGPRDGHDTPGGGPPHPSRVVVIGGGNAAVDAARTALRRAHQSSAGDGRGGATGVEVTLACIEHRGEMPALPDEIAAAEREGVVICAGVRPKRLERGGVVLVPVAGEVSERRVAAEFVVLAIGQEPDLDFLEGDSGPALARTAEGLLAVEPGTCRTSHPRVFAAGDVIAGPRTVTAAMAWGSRAAWGVDLALRGAADASFRTPPARPDTLTALGTAAGTIRAPAVPRVPEPELEGPARSGSFDEVVGVYDEAAARAEARRCLLCGMCGNCRTCIDTLACPSLTWVDGRVGVDASLCIACGVCAHLCADGALGPSGHGGAPEA